MGLYKREEKKRIAWHLALIAVLSIAAYGLSSVAVNALDEWSNEFELKPRLSAPVSGLAQLHSIGLLLPIASPASRPMLADKPY
jgi:hypothetical protein